MKKFDEKFRERHAEFIRLKIIGENINVGDKLHMSNIKRDAYE